MATKTSTLKLVIAGDNKGALKAVGGVEKGLGGLQGKLGGLGGAIGGAFSIGAITSFGKAALDTYSQQAGAVAQIKRLTGGTAEDASLLAFAASQAGIEVSKVATSAGILATNIKNGKVEAAGIATTDSNGGLLTFDQILAEIADKLKALPAGFQRTALARQLFGRGGADMAKILQGGSVALEEQRDTMKGLGLEFNENGLKKYGEFIHSQREMKAAVAGFEVEVAQKFVPAITSVTKWFSDLDPSTRTAILGISGVTAVVSGAALGIGLLGPPIKRTLEFFNIWPGAAGAAAASTDTLAVSSVAASEAALAEAASSDALVAALQLVGASEEEIAIATGQKAAAEEAAALAAKEEAAANSTLLASLGPLALALAAAFGVYKAIKDATDGHRGSLHLNVDEDKELGATNAQLKEAAQNINALDKSKFSEEPLTVLKAMRSTLEKSDPAYKTITNAIREQEAAEKRATANKKKFGGATEDTTAALKDEATAFRQLTSATDAVDSATSSILDTQRGMPNVQKDYADAVSDAAQADKDLAEARRAAAGDSDEYRSALESVAQAEQQVSDDRASVLEAIQAVDEARVEARKHLDELRQSVIDTADAERDARTEAKRAELELRRKNDDPRATALDREEAQNAATDAEHKAQAAAQDHTQAVQENAAAQAAGVEGDKGVVDAKKAVADAEDKVRDSVKGVAKANQDAAKVITDAKAAVVEASKRAVDANATERQAWLDLKTAQDGASASLLNYIALLDFLKDTVAAVGAIGALVGGDLTGNALNGVLGIGALPSFPGSVTGAGQPGTGGGHPLPAQAPGAGLKQGKDDAGANSAPRSLRTPTVVINQIHTGTPRQVGRASSKAAARELDKMFRGGR